MAVFEQSVTDRYAAYRGDCLEVMPELPDGSVGLSLYSPPFAGLFEYSSDERDLSNCLDYRQFFEHYEFVVREVGRLTMPGRCSAVHCMDMPRDGANLNGGLTDFPGDIIRLHERLGWKYVARYCVWKEPLKVRRRTMAKGLRHYQLVEDSSLCENAAADYLLVFRRNGVNPSPIRHPVGLTRYAGSQTPPSDVLRFRGWTGDQKLNLYSHWCWRRYASAFWDDVRIDRVLPYKQSREPDDERHVHPLQLDVVERAVVLWSNPEEIILTPFLGVGSEAYGAVINGRRAIGIELKASYYRQAIANLKVAEENPPEQESTLFDAESCDDLMD